MVKRTLLTTFVLALIQAMPAGTRIVLRDFYGTIRGLLQTGPPPGMEHLADLWQKLRDCAARGDLANEPRYRNDIRWAIRHAANAGILKHGGTRRSGEWLRV
jgi:hypothetical protein